MNIRKMKFFAWFIVVIACNPSVSFFSKGYLVRNLLALRYESAFSFPSLRENVRYAHDQVIWPKCRNYRIDLYKVAVYSSPRHATGTKLYMSLRLDKHYATQLPDWADENLIKLLGPRLGAIASLVHQDASVLDAGTDHGLLAIGLATSGRARRVVASDVHEEPLDNCRSNLAAAGPSAQARIDVRLGDGLSVLSPGEVDTVTIAGMGGAKVVDILFGGGGGGGGGGWPSAEEAGIRRAVVQPTSNVEDVRAALCGRGWTITDEGLTSSGRWAHIILAADAPPRAAAAGGPPPGLSEEDVVLGPLLRRRPACPLYRAWLRRQLDYYRAVERGGARAGRCGQGDVTAGRRVFILERFMRPT
jgi:tRNA (adenine22-N1)-methyltransferase